ncbi:hypothetical protein BDQ94DRAFT_136934 [Aspergillus welwitschiae]|uniref:Uncharacterized protein n=1 Tax=Aspergillus welwitschiae TaxID=1341132 RepID=A0A3F3QCA4_9EURO|nr:hypothetical protein BDQ94DRAFT_136934 [Aspergillus welwitschiae]RDH36818.1 hypothetical protein BDQ94DRAFT_136934 [Aspergillus welwitschiae]
MTTFEALPISSIQLRVFSGIIPGLLSFPKLAVWELCRRYLHPLQLSMLQTSGQAR